MTETQERKDYAATAGIYYTKYRSTAFRSVRATVIFIRGV